MWSQYHQYWSGWSNKLSSQIDPFWHLLNVLEVGSSAWLPIQDFRAELPKFLSVPMRNLALFPGRLVSRFAQEELGDQIPLRP